MKRAAILLLVAIFTFTGIFSAAAAEKQLSSITIKRIKDAIAKLEDPARGVQRKGYRQVKDFGEAAVPYITEELKKKDVNFEAKALMCDICGEIKAKAAVPALIDTIRNPSATVRAAAARALGKIGEAQAVDSLLQATQDKDDQVRAEAIWALNPFGDLRIPPRAVEMLGDGDDTVRLNAAKYLDGHPYTAASGPLREALAGDEFASVRMTAAQALGNLRDDAAVGTLSESLAEDTSEAVRRACAIALGTIKSKKAIPALIAALKDDYKDVQLSAAESLKSITKKDFGRDQKEWNEWYTRKKK